MSLLLSSKLTSLVQAAYESGELFERVTPLTAELLHFWFDEGYCDNRTINFHDGQKQAILNTIYCHEVLQAKHVEDLYTKVDSALSLEDTIIEDILETKRYSFPRYCMKMATGTGKTFVLHALLIRQYLNAHEGYATFSNNFLIVAPGLIVYERLLDAFLGKVNMDRKRDFSTSDYRRYQALFCPPHHYERVIDFVQSHIVSKEEIGRKVLPTGQIILTNRHKLAPDQDFANEEDNVEEGYSDPYEEPQKLLKSILPARPGTSAGNALDILDRKHFHSSALEYCKNIPGLVVFNDEAHHLGIETSGSKEDDKKRQQAINYMSTGKAFFMQIDFSATPYIQKGEKKIYFPHIITDFPIQQAIRLGLVKMIAIDKRTQIDSLGNDELDYTAKRDDEGKVIGLSEGQKIMIQAGLRKLSLIDKSFGEHIISDSLKHPKMLIVCEDTKVVPHVSGFLREMQYKDEEFIEIHSDKKGNVSDEEREQIKYKVFSVDQYENPKIVVSVLMLREGFDVNNICVIVPLRASTSGILLEQTIGRGLRLMWREYEDIRMENIRNLLGRHREIDNYIDVLSIVEHPRYYQHREDLKEEGIPVMEDTMDDHDIGNKGSADLMPVELKNDYKAYDFFWPIIANDISEVFKTPTFSLSETSPMPGGGFLFRKSKVGDKETFRSEAVMSGTRFGDYDVEFGIMQAKNYNDYLMKLVGRITQHTNLHKNDDKLNAKGFGDAGKAYYPTLQINLPQLAAVVDEYLRTFLFQEPINYLQDNNRRVLLLDIVANHIIGQMVQMLIRYQDDATHQVGEPIVLQRRLSEVDKLSIRRNYSLPVQKSIYPFLAYPSSNGGLEKSFIEFVDREGEVEAFCKIDQNKHDFLKIRYIREDGIPAYYHPDFIVRTAQTIYLVETKASAYLNAPNVQRKKKSASYYLKRINTLPAHQRDNRLREYVLLGETQFYMFKESGASLIDILEKMKLYEQTSRLL